MTLQTGFYYAVELQVLKPRPREKADASAVRNLKNQTKRFVRDFPLFAEEAAEKVRGVTADEFQQGDIEYKRQWNTFHMEMLETARAYHRLAGFFMSADQLAVLEDYFIRSKWQKYDATGTATYWHSALRGFLGLMPSTQTNAFIDILVIDSQNLPEPSVDIGVVTTVDFEAEIAAAQALRHSGT
jgi:hypothetical protein